jgi:hypothetical protein
MDGKTALEPQMNADLRNAACGHYQTMKHEAAEDAEFAQNTSSASSAASCSKNQLNFVDRSAGLRLVLEGGAQTTCRLREKPVAFAKTRGFLNSTTGRHANRGRLLTYSPSHSAQHYETERGSILSPVACELPCVSRNFRRRRATKGTNNVAKNWDPRPDD